MKILTSEARKKLLELIVQYRKNMLNRLSDAELLQEFGDIDHFIELCESDTSAKPPGDSGSSAPSPASFTPSSPGLNPTIIKALNR